MGKKMFCMFVIPKNIDYDDNKYQNSLKAWASHHYGGDVLALKAADGLIQGFVHGCWDPLGYQSVQVNGATKQLKKKHKHVVNLSFTEYPVIASLLNRVAHSYW